jgi:hypothetical protein
VDPIPGAPCMGIDFFLARDYEPFIFEPPQDGIDASALEPSDLDELKAIALVIRRIEQRLKQLTSLNRWSSHVCRTLHCRSRLRNSGGLHPSARMGLQRPRAGILAPTDPRDGRRCIRQRVRAIRRRSRIRTDLSAGAAEAAVKDDAPGVSDLRSRRGEVTRRRCRHRMCRTPCTVAAVAAKAQAFGTSRPPPSRHDRT